MMFTIKNFGKFLKSYASYLSKKHPKLQLRSYREEEGIWEIKVGERDHHEFHFIVEEKNFLIIRTTEAFSDEEIEDWVGTTVSFIKESGLDIFVYFYNKEKGIIDSTNHIKMDNWIPTGKKTERITSMVSLIRNKVSLKDCKTYKLIPSINTYHQRYDFVCNVDQGKIEVFLQKQRYDVLGTMDGMKEFIKELEEELKEATAIENEMNAILQTTEPEVAASFRYEIVKKIINFETYNELDIRGFLGVKKYKKLEKEKVMEVLLEKKEILEQSFQLRKHIYRVVHEMEPHSFVNRKCIYAYGAQIEVQIDEKYREIEKKHVVGITIKEKDQLKIFKKFEGAVEEIEKDVEVFVKGTMKKKRLRYVMQEKNNFEEKLKKYFDAFTFKIEYKNDTEKEKQRIEDEINEYFQEGLEIPVIRNRKRDEVLTLHTYEIVSKGEIVYSNGNRTGKTRIVISKK